MLTGRLREANLKLVWGINALVVKAVGEEDCLDVSRSDIMGNMAIGKMVSLWLQKQYTPDNVLGENNSWWQKRHSSFLSTQEGRRVEIMEQVTSEDTE